MQDGQIKIELQLENGYSVCVNLPKELDDESYDKLWRDVYNASKKIVDLYADKKGYPHL
jgi:hypothetical protein